MIGPFSYASSCRQPRSADGAGVCQAYRRSAEQTRSRPVSAPPETRFLWGADGVRKERPRADGSELLGHPNL